jgi:hypothetical protein
MTHRVKAIWASTTNSFQHYLLSRMIFSNSGRASAGNLSKLRPRKRATSAVSTPDSPLGLIRGNVAAASLKLGPINPLLRRIYRLIRGNVAAASLKHW